MWSASGCSVDGASVPTTRSMARSCSRLLIRRFRMADAEAGGELVERLDDDGELRGLIVIAPHGGDIEPHTDEQAERVAFRLEKFRVTFVAMQGLEATPGRRWWRWGVRVLAHHVVGHRPVELSRPRFGH